MGLHKPFDRHFFVIGGSVKTTGGSLKLAKGQFGIFDVSNTSVDGAKAVSTFKGQPKDKFYELRLGKSDLPVTRSQNNKSFSSFPFNLKGVVDLRVSVPENTEQEVDELIVGYNGINDTTALVFKTGDTQKLVVRLEGEPIGMLGYDNNIVDIPVYMDAKDCPPYGRGCEECDDCEQVDCLPIVLEAIERLKNHQLRGGVKVSEFIEVTPIRSCDTSPTLEEIPYKFFCLDVCDTGDDVALALIQAQYPDFKLERTGRSGAISSYQILIPDSEGTPDAYEQTLPSIIKGCEDCPDGYDELEGGFVYAVTLEDDGEDLSEDVEDLTNAVVGSAIKADAQNDGVGYYTVVLTQKLSDENFNTFVDNNPTATVDFISEVKAMCENDTVNSISWVECGECGVIEQTYTLDLPDNKCGENRLSELQAHYPSLDIQIAPSLDSFRTLTLTGTSGTANINVGGVNYLATFATNLTTTASNFVTTHGSAITIATGAVVTANAGVLTFTDATVGFPTITITNATTNLAGTLGTITAIPSTGGCQTKYITTVQSNLVCDECDPIFKDYFQTEAPSTYEGRKWVFEGIADVGTGCKCGIRLKGKVLEVHPDECLRDQLGFVDSSVKIQASGGFLTEVRAGDEQVDNPFHTEYISRWKRRTHLGGNLWGFEDKARTFFTGEPRHTDLVARMLKGEESHIESDKQYVDYALTVRRNYYSQSFAGREEDNITYHVMVEVGRHEDVENLLNTLAASAGVSTVQAFGK